MVNKVERRARKAAKRGSSGLLLNQIKQRNELMRTSKFEVTDLTSFEIDLSGLSIRTAAQSSGSKIRQFDVNLNIGFLGYDQCFLVCETKFEYDWLDDKEVFHEQILGRCASTLDMFGVRGLCRIHGCEVQFHSGYSSVQGTVRSGAFAIIDTKEVFKNWIDQQFPTLLWTRAMTVRVVKEDGTQFNQLFRTEREAKAERQFNTSLANARQYNANLINVASLSLTGDSMSVSQATQSRNSPRDRILSPRERRLARRNTRSEVDDLPALRSLSLPETDLRVQTLFKSGGMKVETRDTDDIEMGGVS